MSEEGLSAEFPSTVSWFNESPAKAREYYIETSEKVPKLKVEM